MSLIWWCWSAGLQSPHCLSLGHWEGQGQRSVRQGWSEPPTGRMAFFSASENLASFRVGVTLPF